MGGSLEEEELDWSRGDLLGLFLLEEVESNQSRRVERGALGSMITSSIFTFIVEAESISTYKAIRSGVTHLLRDR